MTTAMTLPEVREEVARLADAFNSPLPPPTPQTRWQEEMTSLAATIIRTADLLLSRVHASDRLDARERVQQEAIISGFRQAAYLLMMQANPDQAWFWTPEWQRKQREADVAYAQGRFTRFDSDETFLAALDAARPDCAKWLCIGTHAILDSR